MKTLINALRVMVGTLLVLTGIAKLNDPTGYAFLLQDYFGAAGLHFSFIADRALIFSVMLTLGEIVLGMMILLGYAIKLVRWIFLFSSALLTFLTLYIAYSSKLENCDFMAKVIFLTPELSFWKFFGSFLIAIVIFLKSHLITPVFKLMVNKWILFVCFISSLFIIYEVLTHLPLVDYSPFQEGTSIVQEIQAPQDLDFSPWDFKILRGKEDLTHTVLTQEKTILIVSRNLKHSDKEGWEKISAMAKTALKNEYTVLGVTPNTLDNAELFKKELDLPFDFAQIDQSQARNMIRANPGIMVVEKGTIIEKRHWNSANRLKFK